MKRLAKVLLPIIATGASYSAGAEIYFNGFASVKAGMLFDDPTDLNGDGSIGANEQAFSGDISEDLNFKNLSLFAIQATSDLGDGLSATIQLMAEGVNDFDVDARWAYLSYELNDNWSLQAGRILLPAFYKSEFANVGYAHNHNVLPRTVYGRLTFSTVEGARLVHSSSIGDWSVAGTVGFSAWNGDITLAATGQSFEGSLDNIISGTLELNREWLTLFAGAFTTDANFDSLDAAVTNPLIDGSLGPAVQAGQLPQSVVDELKAAMSFSGDAIYFYYGFDVDYNDWLATYEYAEYGVKDAGDSINEVWYFTAGKRFEDFVVTVTTGEYDQPIDQSHISALNPAVQPLGLAIKTSLAAQYYTMNQLSVAYSFHPSATFKADVFTWDPIDSGEDLTGFSLGIDLVF